MYSEFSENRRFLWQVANTAPRPDKSILVVYRHTHPDHTTIARSNEALAPGP